MSHLYGCLVSFACVMVVRSQLVEHVSKLSGTLTSPNHPNIYPNDMDITWIFSVKPGHKIVFKFTHFDVEDSYEEDKGSCVYDFLEVKEDGKRCAKYCGNSAEYNHNAPVLNGEMETSNKSVIVHFVSDYSNEDPLPNGFVLEYKIVDRDECREKENELQHAYEDWDLILHCNQHCHNVVGSYYCTCDVGFHLHSNKHTCTSDCAGIILNEENGKIKTSQHPQKYAKLSNCDWTVEAKEGITIDFRFTSQFSIEEHYDEGCVYDWLQYEASGVMSEKYCGKRKPNNGNWIKTNAHEIKVMFVSDLTEEETGFELEYKFNRVRCNEGPSEPENGQLELLSDKHHYEFEDVVNIISNKGFYNTGSKSTVCQKDGTWSSTDLKCEKILCYPPNHITGNKNIAKIALKSIYHYGETVAVQCDDDWYEMISGAAEWICGDEAKWYPHSSVVAPNAKGNVPECSPICGQKGNRRILSNVFRRAIAPEETTEIFRTAAIVHGVPAKNGEWPWMAFIDLFDQGLDSSEFCGGSLVSTRTVITAAHCTEKTYKSSIVVFIGASERYYSRDPAIQKFKVADLYQHENYTVNTYESDIAILILDAPVKIGLYARPVCLPRSQREQALPELALTNPDQYQQTGILAGWGITEDGTLPLTLNMARVPPIGKKKCIKLFQKTKTESYGDIAITDNMLCAGYPEEDGKGRDSCQGDSGGPLMFKDPFRSRYYLNGIVSFGSTEKCGEGTFGIYTKVSNYIAWIDNHSVE